MVASCAIKFFLLMGEKSDECQSLIKLFASAICGLSVQREAEIIPDSALFSHFLSDIWRCKGLLTTCSFGVKSGELCIAIFLIFSGFSLLCNFGIFLRMEIFLDSEDTVILSSQGFSRCLLRQTSLVIVGDTSNYC